MSYSFGNLHLHPSLCKMSNENGRTIQSLGFSSSMSSNNILSSSSSLSYSNDIFFFFFHFVCLSSQLSFPIILSLLLFLDYLFYARDLISSMDVGWFGETNSSHDINDVQHLDLKCSTS